MIHLLFHSADNNIFNVDMQKQKKVIKIQKSTLHYVFPENLTQIEM